MTNLVWNRNSAALLVVLIPLVLGLQMAALWVMANASTSEPEVMAQMESATSFTSERKADAGGQASINPVTDPSTGLVDGTQGMSEADNSLPRMETGLAANVMIPMALESTPASEGVPENIQADEQHSSLSQGSVSEGATLQPEMPAVGESMDQHAGLQSPEWLQTRTAENYTMQVERFNDLDALQTFTEQVNLPQPQAYYLQTTGRIWYVLVAGDYTDQQVALQAAAELTQQHPAVKPWVRRFRKIQAQLPE
jgi:septal ring-binding cell division protein DamX